MRASAQSYSFSKSPRKIHDIYSVPGPGVYNPHNVSGFQGFSQSKSPRKLSDYRSYSPGPGQYEYWTSQQRYKLSISKARNRSYLFPEIPGPGHYSPTTTFIKDSPPKFGFSKQPRMPNGTFLTPAPGQYSLPSVSSSTGFTIPKARPKGHTTPSPGPGVYEIPSTIGVAGRKK
jgi:hypothetical protein